jgi:SAM-dependent methyltransferase
MHPDETAARYDRLALWFQEQHAGSSYGVAQLERAIRFAAHKAAALDVGCGSTGRFIDVLTKHGFAAEGVDISGRMVALARERNPGSPFYVGDICTWELPKRYDFISAWDSVFHLPLDRHEPVIRKLCGGLNPGGVLIFTCGGGGGGEISGSFEGEDFDYSTLGIDEFLRLLRESGCECLHVEYDQYPENHVYLIARKT